MPFSRTIAPIRAGGREGDVRHEPPQRAGVPDQDRLALPRPVPAEALGLLPRGVGDERRTLHLRQGGAPEDLSVAALERSVCPQLLADPASQILERRPEAAVGRRLVRVEVARPRRAVVVGAGVVADRLPRRLVLVGIPGRVGHPERIEDCGAHVLHERPARHPLDDEPEKLVAEVAVLVVDLGRRHDPDQGEDIEQLGGRVRPDPVEVPPRHLALEPRGVHQEPADRDALEGAVQLLRGGELREVADGRVVEAQAALVAELQDGRRGDRLADRRDPVERLLVGAPSGLQVGKARGVPPAEPVAGGQAGGDPRQPVLLPVRADLRLQRRTDRCDDVVHGTLLLGVHVAPADHPGSAARKSRARRIPMAYSLRSKRASASSAAVRASAGRPARSRTSALSRATSA